MTALLLEEPVTGFLDYDNYYFRIYFPNEGLQIKLGQQNYQIGFDAALTIQEILYHTITLNFVIPASQYANYASLITGSVPGGGDPVLEDTDIYIEI